jgi:hypothetical protein
MLTVLKTSGSGLVLLHCRTRDATDSGVVQAEILTDGFQRISALAYAARMALSRSMAVRSSCASDFCAHCLRGTSRDGALTRAAMRPTKSSSPRNTCCLLLASVHPRRHHCPIAAPGPVTSRPAQLGAHRIQHDVTRQLPQIAVFVDKHRLVAPLQHMAYPAMPSVESLRIDAVDLAHPPRKRRPQRFDQQVVVIAHQAIRPQAPLEALAYTRKPRAERLPILLVRKIAARASPRAIT